HGQRLLVVSERDRVGPTALLLVGGTADLRPQNVAVRPAGWWAWTVGRNDADLMVDLERGELRGRGDEVIARFRPAATFVHVTSDLRTEAANPDWRSTGVFGRDGVMIVRVGMIR